MRVMGCLPAGGVERERVWGTVHLGLGPEHPLEVGKAEGGPSLSLAGWLVLGVRAVRGEIPPLSRPGRWDPGARLP